MDNKIALEIQSAAFEAAQQVVLDQISKGNPDHGMPKERHVATVADVAIEMLESYGQIPGEEVEVKVGDKTEKVKLTDDEVTKWNRLVLRATFSGCILNDSALRQNLEGKHNNKVILSAVPTLSKNYGV